MMMKVNPALGVIVVAIVLWQLFGGQSVLVRDIIGTPSVLASEMVVLLSSAATWENFAVTGMELAFGLVLAILIGLSLSICLGTDKRVHEVLEPLLIVGNTVPKVILLPMFLMLLGTGYSSKVAFGALHGMLPIAIIVSNGARKTLGSDQVRAAAAMDASGLQLVRYVVLPSVLPYLVSALRLSVSLTLLGVILSEMYIAKAGLGFMLMRLYGELQIPRMLCVVAIIACMAAILDLLFRRLEARIWRDHGFRQPQ